MNGAQCDIPSAVSRCYWTARNKTSNSRYLYAPSQALNSLARMWWCQHNLLWGSCKAWGGSVISECAWTHIINACRQRRQRLWHDWVDYVLCWQITFLWLSLLWSLSWLATALTQKQHWHRNSIDTAVWIIRFASRTDAEHASCQNLCKKRQLQRRSIPCCLWHQAPPGTPWTRQKWRH